MLAPVLPLKRWSPDYAGFEMSPAGLTTWFGEFIAAAAAVAANAGCRRRDRHRSCARRPCDLPLARHGRLARAARNARSARQSGDHWPGGVHGGDRHRSRGSVQSRHRRAAAIADSIPARAGAAVGRAGRRGCVADPPRAAPCRRASRLRDARIARAAHAGRAHPHVHRDAVARSRPVRRRASRHAAGAGSRRTSLVDPDRQRAAAGELTRRHSRTSNRPMSQS